MIKADNIQGFNELTESYKEIFRKFWYDFNVAHEEDTREHIIPFSVKACYEVGYRDYLRFDYSYFGDERWVRVKGNPSIWF